MTPRIPYTDFLCVHCPSQARGHILLRLREFHPEATITQLDDDWTVVETSVGSPQSKLIGSHLPVRFAVGEDELLGADRAHSRLTGLAQVAREHPHQLDSLPGDFSFVVLAKDGRATAVRSCSGIPRVFAFHRAGVTAVGTRLDWLARVLPTPLELDAARLACDDHALGIAPNHASAIAGITIVPVGHAAHVGGWDTPRMVAYWDPLARPALDLTTEEIAAEIEALLRRELLRHLDPTGPNAVLYSGGLDSALLTALCADMNVPLDGVSIVPPVGNAALTRERYYVTSLTKLFRSHHVRHLDSNWLLKEAADHAGSLSPIVSSEWQALRSLGEAPRTIITGWFADECFGHLRIPELFKNRLPRFRALAHACDTRAATKMWYRRRRAGRSPFQTDALVASPLFDPIATRGLVGWLRSVTWMPRPEQHAERLLLHRRLTDIAGAYAEASSLAHARTSAPFASRGMVELAARLDLERLFHHKHAKAPLRTLARRLLPKSHPERPDKGDWGLAPTDAPCPAIPAELARVLDMDYLQAHPSLTLDEVGTLLWLAALERGRARIEHDRQSIWTR